MSLAELARDSQALESAGASPEIAAFYVGASEEVKVMARLLSCALVLPAERLIELRSAVDVLPGPPGDLEGAIAELERWPFVTRGRDGYRVAERYSTELRAEFVAEEPEAFRAAHEVLARWEAEAEAEADPEETWFVRGRLAYYLAATDADASVLMFAEGFGDPPMLERTDARMWLSALALRQEPLLPGHQRAIAFFRGFRLYVLNAPDEARSAFDVVVAAQVPDRYHALATHFSGLLRRRNAPERGMELLAESIASSADLGLRENEVMARQSLVTALIARGSTDDRGEAWTLAQLNLARAKETQDDYLILWCRRSLATAEWLARTRGREDLAAGEARANTLIDELLDVAAATLEDDPEGAAIATNEAAGILRDLGRYSDAFAAITRFLEETTEFRVPRHAVQRLAKTAGSMLRLAEPGLKDEIRTFLNDFNTT